MRVQDECLHSGLVLSAGQKKREVVLQLEFTQLICLFLLLYLCFASLLTEHCARIVCDVTHPGAGAVSFGGVVRRKTALSGGVSLPVCVDSQTERLL